jgi:hypothetical protein
VRGPIEMTGMANLGKKIPCHCPSFCNRSPGIFHPQAAGQFCDSPGKPPGAHVGEPGAQQCGDRVHQETEADLSSRRMLLAQTSYPDSKPRLAALLGWAGVSVCGGGAEDFLCRPQRLARGTPLPSL